MKKISRRDWIEEGFRALTDAGPQALTIDTLCMRLGVTKGSFYHHFKNRQDYVKELLEVWKQETTVEIMDTSRSEPHVGKKIDTLLRLVYDVPKERDLAIRALTLYEPEAREFQEEVDRNRRAHLEQLNRSIFKYEDDAALMGIIDYAWYLGTRLMVPPPDKESMEKMTALYKELKQSYLKMHEEKGNDNR
jgi:AcrR family transcriptional regulator